MNRKEKSKLRRICIAAVGLLVTLLFPLPALPKSVLSLAVYFVIGYDVLKKAGKGILNRRVFDENFLMALATVGAIALAFYQKSYDFTEAIAVMLFYQVGEFFESYAVGKSRKSISSLMDIRPDYANIVRNGVLVQVDPEEIAVGSVIVVQPGERIPIDGVVCAGNSSLNKSALTGESLPREVSEGDAVISGCINMTGLLRITTTKEFSDSTVAKILELVEESSARKSKSENFIAKFSRFYTPAVCCCALALAVLPPILGLGAWNIWIYRALTFLVISCPCALVISIPLSFFAGLGGASREGILIKGANYLETLSKVKTVVMDKTGTLTKGVFEVTEVAHRALPREELLYYAAHAECASSHPISRSLVAAFGSEIDRSRVTELTEHSGSGVTAVVDGKVVAVGNAKLMEVLGIPCPGGEAAGTVVHMAINGAYAGEIQIADVEKPNAKQAVSALKQSGICEIVMLTGDNQASAKAVADKLGIMRFYSELLPGEKVEKVEKLLKNGTLAFVGDGINDAPVLSRADIGIAMGAIGSDAAIEAADVVLMDDDPMKLVTAIRISRKTLDIVWQNIIFSLGVKGVCLLLGALGLANMGVAIFADVGVMVLAVLNAIRALNTKKNPSV